MIRRPAWILALLTLLNLLNYLDRFLVSALSPRFQPELGLGDAQVGLVLSAFMGGYFLTSPFFGWLGDRGPRKPWMVAGVLLWSLATMASGRCSSLGSLLLARVCVGVGEASYGALGPALIDQLAPADRRSRWQAIFFAAIPVGSALGFLLGGWLEVRVGWRQAFGLAGVPGLLLGLLLLTVVEPPRQGSASTLSSSHGVARGGLFALLRLRSYRLAVLGYAAQTFALGGFTAWAAPFLVRRFGMELHRADFAFGLVTVLTGLAGTLLGGWWTDRLPGEDRVPVCLRVCALSSFLAAPLALTSLLLPSTTGFFCALGAAELCLFLSVAPINVAILQAVPSWQRAGAMASSIFVMHLLGDLPSPTLIGLVSDALGSGPFGGPASGMVVAMLALPLALALSGWSWWRGAQVRA